MRFRLVPVLLAAVGVAGAILFTAPGRAGEEAESQAQAELARLGEAYRAAFDSGDAEALSRCFTEYAQFVGAAGRVVNGRSAIRALAAEHFEAEPGARLTSERRRVRLIAEGVAIIEGVATRRNTDDQVVSRAGYTALCVKGTDGWQIADLKESELSRADDLSPRERLESLAWMVGDWIEEADAARIATSCRFAEDGPYLIQTLTALDHDGVVGTATQRIAWDPLTGGFHSWFFDSTGGFGNAIWSETADGWILQSRGVSADGVVRTGTHHLTRDGEDIYRWEAKARMVGDTLIDDQTFVIVRQPPEPR